MNTNDIIVDVNIVVVFFSYQNLFLGVYCYMSHHCMFIFCSLCFMLHKYYVFMYCLKKEKLLMFLIEPGHNFMSLCNMKLSLL